MGVVRECVGINANIAYQILDKCAEDIFLFENSSLKSLKIKYLKT
jgi:hypothetical protein